jgi:hypothetical protein
MGKASRTKQDASRRERIAAQRAAARRAEQRRRLLLGGGAVLAVIVVVVVLVVVKLNSKSGTAAAASNGPTGAALTSLVTDVTNVPASVLDKVGAGDITPNQFTAGTGAPLTSGGKPEFLYIGAEYCPYCGAERWEMIVALSRFGTFTGLSTIHSSSSDAYPNTSSWTFYGSTYTSKYINFTSVETTRNYREGNSSSDTVPYVTLQTPNSVQQALWTKYDSDEGIPYINLGNKYVEVSNLSPFGPQVLVGKTWTQIATAMDNPSTAIAQGIDGSANYLTAGICKLTNNLPATACTPTVTALESKL